MATLKIKEYFALGTPNQVFHGEKEMDLEAAYAAWELSNVPETARASEMYHEQLGRLYFPSKKRGEALMSFGVERHSGTCDDAVMAEIRKGRKSGQVQEAGEYTLWEVVE